MQEKNNRIAALLDRLLAHDDRRSEIFTYVCFAAAPIAGSAVSFAVNIGAAGGVVEVLRRIVPVSRDRIMVTLAVPIYLYCTSYMLALVANPAPAWRYVLPIATFILFPFLYSSWRLSRKSTVARSVVNASMIACYGALAIAFLQFHFYGVRAEGGAGNAIVFATVTCLAACTALAGAFSRRGTMSLALFGAYCAGSIAILYSGSRITWLALFLSTVVILWIHRRRRHAKASAIAATCAAIAVGFIALVGVQTVPGRIDALLRDWHEMREQGNYDTSVGRRVALWDIGLAAVRDEPILGHGPQSTKALISDGFQEMGLDVSFSHFHNGFLNAWVEAGVFGMVSLAAMFLVAGYFGVRSLARDTTGDEALGATMLISTSATYVVGGTTGIMVGHDILDAMLVTYLAVGAYLVAGTSLLDQKAFRFAPHGAFGYRQSELEHDLSPELAEHNQRCRDKDCGKQADDNPGTGGDRSLDYRPAHDLDVVRQRVPIIKEP